jgi:hypothetical protein
MASIATAYADDPTVGPGLREMLSGTSGKNIQTLLANPDLRKTFSEVLDLVAKDPNVDFGYVKELMTAAENQDGNTISQLLRDKGLTVPPSLALAETLGDLEGNMQTIMQSFMSGDFSGAMGKIMELVMGFIKQLLPSGLTNSSLFQMIAGDSSPDTSSDAFRRTAAREPDPAALETRTRTAGLEAAPAYVMGG